MAVPDYQKLLLPVLRAAADRQAHSNAEVADLLAEEFALTDAERRDLLPSGKQARFDNRVGWARTYLQKAGLLEKSGRGTFRITARGVEVLGSRPNKIDVKFLRQFDEFNAFQSLSHKNGDGPGADAPEATPVEVLESSVQRLRESLAHELLEKIKTCSPRFFERLVVELLVKMGYGGSLKDAGTAVGQSGDGGIDGIIKEDRLGLDAVYIQAKRWAGTVGRPVVQAFAGSLEGHRARKGVLITTSSFSQEAIEYVSRIEKKIVLIDGPELAALMIDYGLGVAEVATYVVRPFRLGPVFKVEAP